MSGTADSKPAVPAAATVPDAPGAGEGAPRSGWTARRLAVLAAGLVFAAWIIVKAADDLQRFAVVTLNGLTLAALFFVVASGFTLIFGLMRVVNMAHGSLYLLGGYLALEMQDKWFKEEQGLGQSLGGDSGAEYNLLGWVLPLILAVLMIGVLGVVMQQVFLRWNQGQDLR